MKRYEYPGAPQASAPSGPTAIYYTGGLGVVFTIINCLFAGIIVFALSRDADSATTAIIVGGIYFAPTTLAGLAILSGSWTQIRRDREEQITIRHYNQMQHARETQYMTVVDPLHIGHVPPAPRALPQQGTFVPATPPADTRIKSACIDFVRGLFGDDGLPNPKMILPSTAKRPGQVQAKKPGPAPLEYLLSLGIVSVGDDGMLFFDTLYYPTLHDATLAIQRGTPAGRDAFPPSPYHPSPLPHYTREGERT